MLPSFPQSPPIIAPTVPSRSKIPPGQFSNLWEAARAVVVKYANSHGFGGFCGFCEFFGPSICLPTSSKKFSVAAKAIEAAAN